MRETVAVAMSGGVDSSVAACLLQEQGYEVIGLTARLSVGPQGAGKTACASRMIEDAAQVCAALSIPHRIVDLTKEFKRTIIDTFCREYLAARTPNPCVRCNELIKFGLLRSRAMALGVKFFATGHYCRIQKRAGHYVLAKAKDKRKDQSYFLYRIPQSQLATTLVPLGEYSKDQVRRCAQREGLSVAHKPDSQEICFLGASDYRDFLSTRLRCGSLSGEIVDTSGTVLGMHRGIALYTVGQRQGLGVALGYPAYVTAIDAKQNRIIVGPRDKAFRKEFLVGSLVWHRGVPKKKIAARVRIRYNHKEAPAVIIPEGRRVRILFGKPQFAVAPGQSAVFYQGQFLEGGGIIEKVLS